MRESVKRRAGVAELKDSRDNARRTSGLLEEAVSLQRSLFVRGAIGEFINGPMYKAFHDLVYSYRDEEWAIVQQRATDRFGVDELALFDLSRDAANRAEAWMLFEEVNHGAEEGKRRYHPAFFQGSEEERRLDQLLEYFNMIGSYWTRGLLKDEDIEPLDSYILFLVDRKAIRYYLQYSGRIWSHRKEIKRREANVPFAHLRRLLERVEAKRAEREG